MSENDLSRREFLAGSVAVGGLLVAARISMAQAKRLNSSEVELNAWIHIRPDSQILFILDKAEMGQGVITGLTCIVAEELGVDPLDLLVNFAQPSAKYGNPKLFGMQVTGGSTSLAGAWEPLRQAAADARARLFETAGKAMNADPTQCKLKADAQKRFFVADTKSEKSIAVGEVADIAATMTGVFEFGAVKGVPKPMSQFQILGQPNKRYDAWDKVTGRTRYGIDVGLEETKVKPLNCALVRSPVRGGKLVDFAPKSAADLGALYFVPLKGALAVVAETFWQAQSAAKKITAQWDPGENAGLDSQELSEAYRAAAARRGKQVSSLSESYQVCEHRFEQCPIKVEATFELPYAPHATMEPMNCTAHFQGSSCTIWAPTQSAAAAREVARQLTGLASSQIQVHTTFLGGGFGRRIFQDYAAEAVAVSQQLFTQFKVDRPVKVTWTREDDFKHDYYRPMVVHRARVGLNADGSVGAWLHHTVGQSILSYINDIFLDSLPVDMLPAGLVQNAGQLLNRAFQLPSVVDLSSVEGLVVGAQLPDTTHVPSVCSIPYVTDGFYLELTNVIGGAPVGFWRSVGHSHTAFAVESTMDDLARKAGRDPLRFREELLERALNHPSLVSRFTGARERIQRLQQTLQTVKTSSQWGASPTGRYQGVALHESFGTFCAMVMEVSVQGAGADRKVRVHRVFAAVDCGFAVTPDIVKAQVEGAVVYGLTAALKQKITLAKGEIQQNNFYDCDLLRMNESPEIHVEIVRSSLAPSGIGEPGVPPVAPALRNAILAATGVALYKLPVSFDAV